MYSVKIHLFNHLFVLCVCCRRIINDSLRTDVALLYPPYLIALAAMYMACSMQQKDAKQWFAELSVDMDKVGHIILPS